LKHDIFPETSAFSLFGLKVFLASQNSAADVISIQRVQRENRNCCDVKCKTRIRKSRQLEEMEKEGEMMAMSLVCGCISGLAVRETSWTEQDPNVGRFGPK